MTIPATFDPQTVEQIRQRLGDVAGREAVAIPLAIESGSRAWGFPSPDSDYDCRFVYVRGVDAYLTPWPPRDVIETPLDAVLDVMGKLLALLLKGNAVAIEWLRSPIHYRMDAGFRGALLDFAEKHVPAEAVRRHYFHLGGLQWQRRGSEAEAPVKKLFYALRPAASLRWLRLHPGQPIAPMHFPTVLAECDPPADLRAEVEDMIRRKATTRELGKAPVPPVVRRFIEDEFEIARQDIARMASTGIDAGAREAAATLFRMLVRSYGP